MKYLNKRGSASSINTAKFGSKQRKDVIWRDIRRIWSNNVDYFEQFKDNETLKGLAETYGGICAPIDWQDFLGGHYEDIIKEEKVPDTTMVRYWIKQAFEALLNPPIILSAMDLVRMQAEEDAAFSEIRSDFEPIPETHDEYCERECV